MTRAALPEGATFGWDSRPPLGHGRIARPVQNPSAGTVLRLLKKWRSLLKKRSHARPFMRGLRRATTLNRTSHDSTGNGFSAFLWPSWIKARGTIATVHSWQRSVCRICFRHCRQVRSHNCAGTQVILDSSVFRARSKHSMNLSTGLAPFYGRHGSRLEAPSLRCTRGNAASAEHVSVTAGR